MEGKKNDKRNKEEDEEEVHIVVDRLQRQIHAHLSTIRHSDKLISALQREVRQLRAENTVDAKSQSRVEALVEQLKISTDRVKVLQRELEAEEEQGSREIGHFGKIIRKLRQEIQEKHAANDALSRALEAERASSSDLSRKIAKARKDGLARAKELENEIRLRDERADERIANLEKKATTAIGINISGQVTDLLKNQEQKLQRLQEEKEELRRMLQKERENAQHIATDRVSALEQELRAQASHHDAALRRIEADRQQALAKERKAVLEAERLRAEAAEINRAFDSHKLSVSSRIAAVTRALDSERSANLFLRQSALASERKRRQQTTNKTNAARTHENPTPPQLLPQQAATVASSSPRTRAIRMGTDESRDKAIIAQSSLGTNDLAKLAMLVQMDKADSSEAYAALRKILALLEKEHDLGRKCDDDEHLCRALARGAIAGLCSTQTDSAILALTILRILLLASQEFASIFLAAEHSTHSLTKCAKKNEPRFTIIFIACMNALMDRVGKENEAKALASSTVIHKVGAILLQTKTLGKMDTQRGFQRDTPPEKTEIEHMVGTAQLLRKFAFHAHHETCTGGGTRIICALLNRDRDDDNNNNNNNNSETIRLRQILLEALAYLLVDKDARREAESSFKISQRLMRDLTSQEQNVPRLQILQCLASLLKHKGARRTVTAMSGNLAPLLRHDGSNEDEQLLMLHVLGILIARENIQSISPLVSIILSVKERTSSVLVKHLRADHSWPRRYAALNIYTLLLHSIQVDVSADEGESEAIKEIEHALQGISDIVALTCVETLGRLLPQEEEENEQEQEQEQEQVAVRNACKALSNIAEVSEADAIIEIMAASAVNPPIFFDGLVQLALRTEIDMETRIFASRIVATYTHVAQFRAWFFEAESSSLANVVRRFAEKAHEDASAEELYFHLAVAVALATQNTDVYSGMGKLQTAMHGFQEAETGLIRTLMYLISSNEAAKMQDDSCVYAAAALRNCTRAPSFAMALAQDGQTLRDIMSRMRLESERQAHADGYAPYFVQCVTHLMLEIAEEEQAHEGLWSNFSCIIEGMDASEECTSFAANIMCTLFAHCDASENPTYLRRLAAGDDMDDLKYTVKVLLAALESTDAETCDASLACLNLLCHQVGSQTADVINMSSAEDLAGLTRFITERQDTPLMRSLAHDRSMKKKLAKAKKIAKTTMRSLK
eukprot:g4965.t1